MFDRNLLPAIVAFSAVAREGNFTRAARQLGISPSALSQTIRALEERLGARLLHRSTRSVSATEDGRRFLMQIDPGLALISQGVDSVLDRQGTPVGDVRINTSRIAADHFLKPHLGEFSHRYPQVRLEIIIDDGFGDIIGEGCDAGIRLRESVVGSMIAVPISPPISLAVVASPAYFANCPAPHTPHDLGRHNCLRFRHGRNGTVSPWEFSDPVDESSFIVEPSGNFLTNGDEVMLGAALQGVGLVMHMDFAVQEHVDRGSLVRVLQDWCPPFDGFDLYLPSREQMPGRLRALVDFLVEKRKARLENQTGSP